MSLNTTFGEIVEGYDVRVLNEREARAAAGILFIFGFLSFMNSFMLGNFVFTQYFVGFFMVDFLIRVINQNYSPSLLLGRVFVQNQIPEYVGASQKRFAWSIGLVLSIFMFYLVVIDPQMNPIKIVICIICLGLLISESAFSICLGCKMYNFIKKEKATNCPGGVCETRTKDAIQTFNMYQKSIVSISTISITIGLYLFSMQTPNNSVAMKMMPVMMMSESKIIIMKEKAYQDKIDAEFNQYDESDESLEEKVTSVSQMKCASGKCGAGKCGGAK